MERPDDPAFIMATSGETVTLGEYERRANRVAHFYRDVGLQRGDHVAFFIENNPRMLECEGGAERTGLYFTCINSYLSPEEVAYIINDCEAQVVMSRRRLQARCRAGAATAVPECQALADDRPR